MSGAEYQFWFFFRQFLNWVAGICFLFVALDIGTSFYPDNPLSSVVPFADLIGYHATMLGTLLVALTVYIPAHMISPPEKLSKNITAWCVAIGCLVLIALKLVFGIGGSLSASGIAVIGLVGALFRTTPNPADGADKQRF